MAQFKTVNGLPAFSKNKKIHAALSNDFLIYIVMKRMQSYNDFIYLLIHSIILLRKIKMREMKNKLG